MKKCFYVLFLVICFMAAPLVYMGSSSIAHAQGLADMADDSAKAEDTEGSKKQSAFSLHGFLRTNLAIGKDDYEMVNNFEVQKGGVTLQLQFEGFASNIAHFYAATNIELDLSDFYGLDEDRLDYNFIKDEYYLNGVERYLETLPFLKIVEAYIDLYPAEWLSIRTGKQIITWGEIEGIEAPTDIITPWDYTTKSTVFEESRMGIWALAFNFFFAKQKLELIWCPIPQPSKMLKKDILAKATVGGVTTMPRVQRLDIGLDNGEYALRMSGNIGGFFRYGAAFLYGFDDLPDSEIKYNLSPNPYTTVQAEYDALMTDQSIRAYLVYHRVMVPTLDFAFDVKDIFSIKSSTVLYITEDFEGNRDEYRNSYVKYLIGVESTNIGADIYFALYVGQHWIINYTEYHGPRAISRRDALAEDWNDQRISNTHNLISNREIMEGFDEKYRYKWLISGIIQRNFLKHKNLEIGLRYGLSASPKFDDVDYILNLNFMYRIIDGVSMTVGAVCADKIDIIKNLLILEFQYSF